MHRFIATAGSAHAASATATPKNVRLSTVSSIASWARLPAGVPGAAFLCHDKSLMAKEKRTETEDALPEDGVLFRELFENSATGVALFSIGGRFMRVNPAFCRMLG